MLYKNKHNILFKLVQEAKNEEEILQFTNEYIKTVDFDPCNNLTITFDELITYCEFKNGKCVLGTKGEQNFINHIDEIENQTFKEINNTLEENEYYIKLTLQQQSNLEGKIIEKIQNSNKTDLIKKFAELFLQTKGNLHILFPITLPDNESYWFQPQKISTENEKRKNHTLGVLKKLSNQPIEFLKKELESVIENCYDGGTVGIAFTITTTDISEWITKNCSLIELLKNKKHKQQGTTPTHIFGIFDITDGSGDFTTEIQIDFKKIKPPKNLDVRIINNYLENVFALTWTHKLPKLDNYNNPTFFLPLQKN
jgi:hypothetical protein